MPFILPAVLGLVLLAMLWRRQKALTALRREAYIRSFTLPPRLFEPLRAQHPHLDLKHCQLVAQGLRQFFMAYLKSGQRYVSMPSQVVDDLWHEFILHTRDYQEFCDKAFGQFLHHTPAAVLGQGAEKKVTSVCAAVGGSPATTRTSTRARPRACRCCSPSMPS